MARVGVEATKPENSGNAENHQGRPVALSAWLEDLAPISDADWNYACARHLLNRAGFGGTPNEITRLARMTPDAALRSLVDHHGSSTGDLPAFVHSGVYDPTLNKFPPTRPAATTLASETGQAMGVAVKPTGPRRLQPVANRFFYWLRASALETRRVANWWANRMVASDRPLQEKMALFWHGHFASGAEKVRDPRKMLGQVALFQQHATGSFRQLLHDVARDPAMLAFLDAGQNVKGRPNENFGREVMELFTMGVGRYSEQDIREAARAFTGWGDDGLAFRIDAAKHDDGDKTFLGRTGRFDGDQILDIILEQDVTATFLAGKLYRFFVREDLSPAFQERLGAVLREGDYDVGRFLRTVFLSRDFYSPASVGTHIMGPVELIISTYRRLGLKALPGVPDFNAAGSALGQVLLNPPTVAGWAQGRAWITPGSLLTRGNFARDVVFPDMIDFVDPNLVPDAQVRRFNTRILAGMDITTATSDSDARPEKGPGMEASLMAGKAALLSEQEEFNTHYASLKGWEEAVRKVKPTLRDPAQFSLTDIVFETGARTTSDAVDVLLDRFLSVPLDEGARAAAIDFLDGELGTSDLIRARSYAEDPLRLVAHLIMSTPEYQLA